MASEPNEYEILARFRDRLHEAAGCAWQLAHVQQNPNWLRVRAILEQVRESTLKLGQARAMPRQDVLAMLDRAALRN